MEYSHKIKCWSPPGRTVLEILGNSRRGDLDRWSSYWDHIFGCCHALPLPESLCLLSVMVSWLALSHGPCSDYWSAIDITPVLYAPLLFKMEILTPCQYILQIYKLFLICSWISRGDRRGVHYNCKCLHTIVLNNVIKITELGNGSVNVRPKKLCDPGATVLEQGFQKEHAHIWDIWHYVAHENWGVLKIINNVNPVDDGDFHG